MNTDRFYFSEDRIMVNFNWITISSDNKRETEYILSLLNSKCNRFLFNSLLRSESEKDVLIGIKVVKEFFRIPLINSGNNRIKNEVIKRTEEMLSLEDKELADYVDFSNLLVQKFNDIKIDHNTLILTTHNERVIELKITGDVQLIAHTIAERFGAERDYKINLSELRNLPVLNYEKQARLIDNIDDLVFALYFVPLKDESIIHNPDKIKELCSQNKYNKLFL